MSDHNITDIVQRLVRIEERQAVATERLAKLENLVWKIVLASMSGAGLASGLVKLFVP